MKAKKMIRTSNTAALVISILLPAAWGTPLRAAQVRARAPARGTQVQGKYFLLGSDPFEIELLPGNKADYRGSSGPTLEVDYEVRGTQVVIRYPEGTVVAAIGDNGCLDGGAMVGSGELCKPLHPEGGELDTSISVHTTNYLKEMPEPARVLADIRGSDSLDTAARQRVAFERLRDIIEAFFRTEPSPSGISTFWPTQEERELNGRYSQAWGKIVEAAYHTVDPNDQQRSALLSPRADWNRLRDQYWASETFLRTLLQRYLSPRTRDRYMEALRARLVAAQQFEQANAPSSSVTRRPVPPAPCEQLCGFITVNLTGRAMPVYIDNFPVGRTPLTNYKIKAGQHTIRMRVGYRMVIDTVQVDSGATVVKSYDAAGH